MSLNRLAFRTSTQSPISTAGLSLFHHAINNDRSAKAICGLAHFLGRSKNAIWAAETAKAR